MINEPCFRARFLVVTGTGRLSIFDFAFAIGLRLFYMLHLFFSLAFPSNLDTLSLHYKIRRNTICTGFFSYLTRNTEDFFRVCFSDLFHFIYINLVNWLQENRTMVVSKCYSDCKYLFSTIFHGFYVNVIHSSFDVNLFSSITFQFFFASQHI